jgi:nicotinamidase-related amidase
MHAPDLDRLIEPLLALLEAHPDAAVFTRFMTPRTPAEAQGVWRRYYERWRNVTLDVMNPAMLDLTPAPAACVPSGEVIEERSYGGFETPAFVQALRRQRGNSLVLTGVGTEVCVLEDAVSSSVPEGHRAALDLMRTRFGYQIDIATVEDVLAAWPSDRLT